MHDPGIDIGCAVAADLADLRLEMEVSKDPESFPRPSRHEKTGSLAGGAVARLARNAKENPSSPQALP